MCSNSTNESVNNCFEPEWVPSHKEPQDCQKASTLEPWNTIGIPHTGDIKLEFSEPTSKQIVRKAVQNIESGLYSSNCQKQDSRKESVKDKIDISQMKLYWQEKEKKSKSSPSRSPFTVDYRTDYQGEGEKDENVIFVKISGTDGIVLKADKTIRQALEKCKDRGIDIENNSFEEKEAGHLSLKRTDAAGSSDYEKNWNRKDFLKRSHHYSSGKNTVDMSGISEHSKNYTSEIIKFNSNIPRVKTYRKRNTSKKKITKSHFYHSESLDNSKVKKIFHSTRTENQDKENREQCTAKSNNNCWLYTDPQRSRANFFGNSGSYTLRCDLNPISHQKRKKFYLTPTSSHLEHLMNGGRIRYENFTAKKREFVKKRVNPFEAYRNREKNAEAVMW